MQFLNGRFRGPLKAAVHRTGVLALTTGLCLLFSPVVVHTASSTLFHFVHLVLRFCREVPDRALKTSGYGKLTHGQ